MSFNISLQAPKVVSLTNVDVDVIPDLNLQVYVCHCTFNSASGSKLRHTIKVPFSTVDGQSGTTISKMQNSIAAALNSLTL